MKRILSAFVIAGLLFVFWLLFIKPVSARQQDYLKVICHHTPANTVTLAFHTLQAYNGHLGQPHSGQTYDTNGACASASPSSTPEPSETPEASPTPTPVPSDEPEATPEAEVIVTHDQLAPVDTAWHPESCQEIKYTPTIIEVKRNNPISIYVAWSKVDEGVAHYLVEYGLSQGIPLWNTVVEGNSTDLNFLPMNHLLWVRVAGISKGGCVGSFSEWIDP